MKTLDYVLLSIATVFFIIGVDQIIRLKYAIVDTYWIFMVTAMCLIWLNLRKAQQKNEANPPSKPNPDGTNPKKKKSSHS